MLQTPEDQDQEQETHQLAAQSLVAHTPGASADVELMRRSHISQHGKQQQQEEMQQLQLFPAQASPVKDPLSQVHNVLGQAKKLELRSNLKRLGRRQEDGGDLEAGLSERQVRIS